MITDINTAHLANPDTLIENAHGLHLASEFNTAHNVDSAHAATLTESPNRAQSHQHTSPRPNQPSGDPVVAVLTGLLTPLINQLYSVLVHHGIARPIDSEHCLSTSIIGAL